MFIIINKGTSDFAELLSSGTEIYMICSKNELRLIVRISNFKTLFGQTLCIPQQSSTLLTLLILVVSNKFQ